MNLAISSSSRRVPRDELADVLWAGSPPPSWDGALSAVVSKLRGAIGRVGLDGALPTAFDCHQLQLPPDTWVDVEAAHDALHRAETVRRTGHDVIDARNWADVASHILRRPFLPGEEGEWVDGVRERLRRLEVRAHDVLSELWLATGNPETAVPVAERALGIDPFRETAWRTLIRAQAEMGNRGEALRIYERCRRTLAEQLGITPSPETEAVYLDILRS
jgi:DNA-binding SARP family transcriptional activator